MRTVGHSIRVNRVYRTMMDTVTPLLMAITAVLPVLVISVYIYRHKQPDRARLTVLRCLLWFFTALTLVFLVAELRDLLKGHYPHSILWAVLQLVSFALALGSITYSMRACRKRLSRQ